MARDWVSTLGQTNDAGGQGKDNQQTALNPILSLLGGGLGAVAGAGLGGLAGIETGPGALATGYLGGVAGAGAGAAAGNAGADMLNSILFGKNINPQTSLQNTINAGEAGAAGQAIGVPFAKGLGFLAHPIASVLSPVDRILANSPKTVDFFNYLNKVGGQGVQELASKGVGQQAQQYFTDTLGPNLRAAAQETINQAPITSKDILGSGLPVSIANTLKRNLGEGVKSYGERGTPQEELTKTAIRYLKDAIVGQEPNIAKYNKAASILYQIPEFTQNVASILPGKGAKAIDMIGNLLKFAPQKLAPQGGGYLNQAIPRGLQFLFGSGIGQ